MKKILMSFILLFAFSSAHAAGDWKSYYENLLKGLKSKVQKKFESKTRVSAVAAVRGAKQGTDAEALYWKGGVSEKAQKKLQEEKKRLADAVQLVLDGKAAEGKTALESFLKDNPDSLYVQDAKEALSNLPGDDAAPAEETPGTKETKQSETPKTEKGN